MGHPNHGCTVTVTVTATVTVTFTATVTVTAKGGRPSHGLSAPIPCHSSLGRDRWMNMSSVTARCKLIRPQKDTHTHTHTSFLMDGQVKRTVLVLFASLAFQPGTFFCHDIDWDSW